MSTYFNLLPPPKLAILGELPPLPYLLDPLQLERESTEICKSNRQNKYIPSTHCKLLFIPYNVYTFMIFSNQNLFSVFLPMYSRYNVIRCLPSSGAWTPIYEPTMPSTQCLTCPPTTGRWPRSMTKLVRTLSIGHLVLHRAIELDQNIH